MKTGIVGLGLMGGSWALALRNANPSVETIGFDQLEQHRSQAEQLGLVSRCSTSMNELLDEVDQIVLSIPVDAIETLLPEILDQLSVDQAVIDFGSTKSAIAKAVVDHPNRPSALRGEHLLHRRPLRLHDRRVRAVAKHEHVDLWDPKHG